MINLIVLSQLQQLEKEAKDLEANSSITPEEKIAKIEEIANNISKLLENVKLDDLDNML